MIEIEAVFDEAGLLRSCKVQGHAQAGPKGGDIVCAAVTVLTRTALRVLSGREGITIRGNAPKRGMIGMEMDYTAEGRAFLSAAGAFLMAGLASVSEEYPDYCKINVYTERRN
ncbi:MAG: ribosomal-processing cysteine protease Prp [Treponema sp.]|jgi:uncharacterized protein YsxB (DUF464 family)|nr:ribosomal-processing cysteine protease Prp [Treponema sp.]